MEARPASAWLLLLSLISDCLKLVQPREFTVKDIIYLHPSTTPYPGGFKCFTCENAADNYECNRWAPDVYCPRGTLYCYTRHKMNAKGDSSLVTKRCVSLEECLSVGCTEPDNEGNKVNRSAPHVVKGQSATSHYLETRPRQYLQHSLLSIKHLDICFSLQ
ncbi:ly6/PLAUR domain-containing protein 6 isoform X2 [Scyliorhinus torazame]|uniref:ly6/PLAUR domain-containing protein 6 isoform X2 n=1 Tax=Scyliorhinus torazame TaxID=75743 RepID=UPI003B5C9141